MPVSLILLGYLATKSKFEIDISLKTGQFVFSSANFRVQDLNTYRGFSLGNLVCFNPKFTGDKTTFSHEMIHVFQYYEYNFVSKLSKKPIDYLFEKSHFYKSASKIINSDIEGATLLFFLYSAEYKGGTKARYYKNFFECEAGVYSGTINR